MNQKEVWKDVKNYEGIYQVSNIGRVKSLKFNKERILHQTKSGRYFTVILWIDGARKTSTIHQLIASSFLKHKSSKHKIVVDHINNDPEDNRLKNLQLISHRKNISKDRKGTSKYTGVSWCKSSSKWISAIKVKGKYKMLGRFICEVEASKVYQKKLATI